MELQAYVSAADSSAHGYVCWSFYNTSGSEWVWLEGDVGLCLMKRLEPVNGKLFDAKKYVLIFKTPGGEYFVVTESPRYKKEEDIVFAKLLEVIEKRQYKVPIPKSITFIRTKDFYQIIYRTQYRQILCQSLVNTISKNPETDEMIKIHNIPEDKKQTVLRAIEQGCVPKWNNSDIKTCMRIGCKQEYSEKFVCKRCAVAGFCSADCEKRAASMHEVYCNTKACMSLKKVKRVYLKKDLLSTIEFAHRLQQSIRGCEGFISFIMFDYCFQSLIIQNCQGRDFVHEILMSKN